MSVKTFGRSDFTNSGTIQHTQAQEPWKSRRACEGLCAPGRNDAGEPGSGPGCGVQPGHPAWPSPKTLRWPPHGGVTCSTQAAHAFGTTGLLKAEEGTS